MISSTIGESLRRLVRNRAAEQCEYCLMPQFAVLVTHEVDHVLARKHGGETSKVNLALSCRMCNRHKGSDLTSIDPDSGTVVSLYNPRSDTWNEHFYLQEDGVIVPLTPSGRATARLLQFNQPGRVEERRMLIESGEI
jgi:hypothetical protein